MKKIIFTFLFTLFLSIYSTAQEPGVGIGTDSPQAILDITSTTDGILIPRLTATQIEDIQDPNESELVYALSDEGTTVNEKGFWYFQSGEWVKLKSTSSGGNFYTVNGNLISNRIVTQDGNHLNFGPDLLFVSGTELAVGMLTDAPTQALDLNGSMRVQNLDAVANVIADAEGVLRHEVAYFDVGDVKPSFLTTDHDGWYLLDGRALTDLPQSAMDNAVSILGLSSALPNANNRYSIGTTSDPGFAIGNNTVELVRANLPAFNFSYTSNEAGAHAHSVTYQRTRVNSEHGGANNVHAFWLSGTYSEGQNYNANTTSVSHFHTFTINSGGNSTPFDISPTAINANYFVYLGE